MENETIVPEKKKEAPKSKTEQPKAEDGVLISSRAYASMKGLRFTAQSRLENKIARKEIPAENTVTGWDKILKGM